MSRLDAARRTAEQRERETHIRLDLTTRLMAGEEPEAVVAGAADALVALFRLVRCTVRTASATTTAEGPGTPGATTVVRIAPLEVATVASREHPLASSDRALLEALVAGLATAIDRLRLESEARGARIDAQVGRTRSGFLSAVTHNLRTPLASIKAASSTLRAPDLDLSPDDRTELLDTIYDETERLERLVTNILELSRIRAGGLEVRRQPVDLSDLAQAAIRRLRPLARAHRVRLEIPASQGDVEVDVQMMEQVFGNLLENALRFAPPGSEILVSCCPGRAPGEVEVRVADHGPGVPEAERERIFEEFVRVDARPDASGTGLGLAIVHALVTAHGGRVWCEEDGGAAARRSCSWCRRDPDDRGHDDGGSAMTTVLVIEDDTSLRRALRTSLKARGFEVLESPNAEEGLVLVADDRTDVVLLDLGLPDIDGIDALRRMRSFSDVPVVVLTARDRQQDKIEALDAGADDYVTKPFDVEEVLARVRAALRRAPQASSAPAVVQVDGLEIDLVRKQVRLDGDVVHLTKTELALLEQLATQPGKLLTHEYLLRQVWGRGYGSESNYLRVYVGQLRRKLGDDAANPRLIVTEPGIGYRWIGSD